MKKKNASAYLDQTRFHRRQRDDRDEVDEVDGRQTSERDEPEPHHDEDLFAEDVLREKAVDVHRFERAGRAELAEVALSQPGKN